MADKKSAGNNTNNAIKTDPDPLKRSFERSFSKDEIRDSTGGSRFYASESNLHPEMLSQKGRHAENAENAANLANTLGSERLEILTDALLRLAARLAPTGPIPPLDAPCYVWRHDWQSLQGVASIHAWPPEALKGVEEAWERLYRNTLMFARSGRANNALLWGARGAGKSSLVKTCVNTVNARCPHTSGLPTLRLVSLSTDNLASLPILIDQLNQLRGRLQGEHPDAPWRIILFFDDLSFASDDQAYRSLKSFLEGGLAMPFHEMVVYATSNRRHVVAREAIEQQTATALLPKEAIDENVSLADRFGLWLGFTAMDQDTYLAAVASYLGVNASAPSATSSSTASIASTSSTASTSRTSKSSRQKLESWREDALRWAIERGGRSGRVAFQFAQHYAQTHQIDDVERLPLWQR